MAGLPHCECGLAVHTIASAGSDDLIERGVA